MWPMQMEAQLFITAKWAITTKTCPINAALQADNLEPFEDGVDATIHVDE